MSSYNLQLVENAFQVVKEKADIVAVIKVDYNKQLAVVTELQRQYDYHTSRGDGQNASIVQGQLNVAQSQLSMIKNKLDIAQKDYNDALGDYNRLKESVLTPAEKALEEERAKLEQEKDKAEANKTIAQQQADEKKAKLIRIIWITLSVIAFIGLIWLVVYFIRKFRKKQV